MLQVFYEQARQGGTGEGGPLKRSGLCMHAKSEEGTGSRRRAQKLYP
jgi:hypothetical protein